MKVTGASRKGLEDIFARGGTCGLLTGDGCALFPSIITRAFAWAQRARAGSTTRVVILVDGHGHVVANYGRELHLGRGWIQPGVPGVTHLFGASEQLVDGTDDGVAAVDQDVAGKYYQLER